MSILSQQKQSVNTDFPNIRPSLDLRFALAKKLDPRVTFSRGSTGTYFGPDGLMRTAAANEPRFDHDPVTGQSLGLLIEESRTNQLPNSIPQSGTWTSVNCSITANSEIAPDGTQTASLISGDPVYASRYINLNVSITTGTTYTQTFFVKAGTTRFVQVAPSTGFDTTRFANFELSGDGIVGTNNVESASIQRFPNGWYRIRVTQTSTSTVSGRMLLSLVASLTTGRLGNSPISSCYVWGAQLEIGSFPTSYIPTTGSTVTRSTDIPTISGNNFSSWYNSSEGTIIATAAPSTNAAYTGWVYLLGTDFNNGISYYRQADYQPVFRMRSGVRDEYHKVYGALGFGTLWRNAVALKSAFALKTNDFNTCVSGGFNIPFSRATSGTLPTFTGPLYFGSTETGTQKLNGTISRFTYYPIKLTDQQLINLTS